MGASVITPEIRQEISSLRAEHEGAVGTLLILYTLQVYMGTHIDTSHYTVNMLIDNAGTLVRGGGKHIGTSLKDNLVLDHDLWTVMNML